MLEGGPEVKVIIMNLAKIANKATTGISVTFGANYGKVASVLYSDSSATLLVVIPPATDTPSKVTATIQTKTQSASFSYTYIDSSMTVTKPAQPARGYVLP